MKPRLDKSLGQHFLTRPEVCAPLIAFLGPAGRKVVDSPLDELTQGGQRLEDIFARVTTADAASGPQEGKP